MTVAMKKNVKKMESFTVKKRFTVWRMKRQRNSFMNLFREMLPFLVFYQTALIFCFFFIKKKERESSLEIRHVLLCHLKVKMIWEPFSGGSDTISTASKVCLSEDSWIRRLLYWACQSVRPKEKYFEHSIVDALEDFKIRKNIFSKMT